MKNNLVFQNKIDDGQVILVNSMSGHRVSPLGAKARFYSATKFAVTALLEGTLMNFELKHFNKLIFRTKLTMGK